MFATRSICFNVIDLLTSSNVRMLPRDNVPSQIPALQSCAGVMPNRQSPLRRRPKHEIALNNPLCVVRVPCARKIESHMVEIQIQGSQTLVLTKIQSEKRKESTTTNTIKKNQLQQPSIIMSHPSKALHVIDEFDERELTRMRSRKYSCSMLLAQRSLSSQSTTSTTTTRTTVALSTSGESCYFTRRPNDTSKRSSSLSSKVESIPQEAASRDKFGGSLPEQNFMLMRQQEQQRRIPEYIEDFSDDENEDEDLLGLKFL